LNLIASYPLHALQEILVHSNKQIKQTGY